MSVVQSIAQTVAQLTQPGTKPRGHSKMYRGANPQTSPPRASRNDMTRAAIYSGKVTRFFDAQTGIEIDPLAIDREAGAPIGTRTIDSAEPE